jgi:hypothetical protein
MSDPKKPFQQFFPCLPTLMEWSDWNGNLAIYYGQTNVMVAPEEQWHAVAHNIVESETFGVYPVPNPSDYETWQEWALDFTETINGKNH